MKIVSSEFMSEIDSQASVKFGIPGVLLMENAGIKCWAYIRDHIKVNSLATENIVIVAGSGNNGGDALVIARQAWISGLRKVKIVLIKDKGNDMFSLHRKICENYGIPVLIFGRDDAAVISAITLSGLIIDGITGTGLRGALRGDATGLVHLINSSSAIRISIDIPSGLGEGFKPEYPAVKTDITLTIGLPKNILYYPGTRAFAGKIIVVSIGFPPSLLEDPVGAGELYTAEDLNLPDIPDWAYKGTRGHTAVFAGSEGTVGAAVLSASAAGRAGTGLVTLFSDSNVYKTAASQLKSIMVRKLDYDGGSLILDGVTSLLAGPGWGRAGRGPLLEKLFDSGLPGVLDADGMYILSELEDKIQKKPGYLEGRWVFTPHPGEFSRISDLDKEEFLISPLPYLREAAAKYGAVIVLKSHVTFIVNPYGDYSIVDGMNPAMGTGGSGDILAGIIAGFLAQGMQPYKSAVMGVILHQAVGRTCFEEKGWFLAEDLLPYISSTMKKGISDVQ